MAPTISGLPAGVTASNFSIGTFTLAALSDNGGSGNSLRLSRGDVGTSSATALAGPVLSFTLTIPAGTTLNLTSLALDFTSGGVTGAEYINARVFSSIDGYDDLNADTIGTLGRVANGADSGTMSVSLTTPDSNPTNGANSNNGDFDSLTNRTVTFYLPFIRDAATTATDYVDIDNITLSFRGTFGTRRDHHQLRRNRSLAHGNLPLLGWKPSAMRPASSSNAASPERTPGPS